MIKSKLNCPLKYRYEYRVRRPEVGADDPVDMYRYDESFPIRWDMPTINGVCYWLITCVHYDIFANWKPTTARWESFGWEVLND